MKLHEKNLIWFTKWLSSFVIITGMAATTANLYPYNLYLHLMGIIGWLIVSLVWHDKSLIVLNTVAAFIFLNGIVFSII